MKLRSILYYVFIIGGGIALGYGILLQGRSMERTHLVGGSSGGSDDPWGSAPQSSGGGGGYSDEPPF